MRKIHPLLFAPALLFSSETIPEDRGAVGLHQALKKISTSARVLYITAHPDDEDGGTIAALTRGLGADLALLSLTRGESGANLVTADFFDSLGALRTLELSKSAQYYACRLLFTPFVDYGYSKNVDEAWRNWDREKLLADVVRIVRMEQPHVVISRWQGTPRDGHGHHSAAGVITPLAFAAAADPKRFPEQLADGLKPWAASKLYARIPSENDEWTLAIDAGAYDPFLGRSYAQIARDGLRWQRSQGAGAGVSRPGSQVAFYKRLAGPGPEKETGFFDGIEDLIAPPKELKPFIDDVWRNFTPTIPAAPARYLAAGLSEARKLNLPRTAGLWQDALNASLALEIEALVQTPTFLLATPGQSFDVVLQLHNHTRWPLRPTAAELVAAPGWKTEKKEGGVWTVTVPDKPLYTKAGWNRDSVTAPRYTLEDPADFGRPLPAPPLIAKVTYETSGVRAAIESPVKLAAAGQLQPLAVGPALSVRVASEFGVLPAGKTNYEIPVTVRNLSRDAIRGELSLELPRGWRAAPAAFNLEKENQEATTNFQIVVPPGRESAFTLRAVAKANGREYRASFTPHTYASLDTLWMERPALHVVRRVDVKVAPGIRAGYVMGTGDDVPAALKQLGIPYDLLGPDALAAIDLSKYSTILLGIRAYAARAEVRTHNQRLLDYVANGGVLVVQYNTPEYDNNYGPFPYTMGRNPEEVSEENSPVAILDPADPVFNTPNKIAPADFEGWIEQRGSKFLTTWDPRWKPLLETHDTGQQPQKGGWLVARHGKGLYVYCAYAWYRQLPFAVPGAVRLFANLVSLGAR